jgi:hypothetical protein
MGKLDPGVAREFARHCEVCPECARISAREREVIRMIRAALAEEPTELMTTCDPVIRVTRWPKFTKAVQSQIARNEYQAAPLRIRSGGGTLAKGLLTFRWFRYRAEGEGDGSASSGGYNDA